MVRSIPIAPEVHSTISRPSVSANIQNAVLASLVGSIENVPLRTRPSQDLDISGRQQNAEEVQFALDLRALDPQASGVSAHFVVGINSVTRALEAQLRATRKRVIVGDHQLPPLDAPSPIVVVFACCADVDPPALIAHIPHLVAGCNSSRNVVHPIRLVPLPKGAESTISQTLGVRRAAILAFRVWFQSCSCAVSLLTFRSSGWITLVRNHPRHSRLRSHPEGTLALSLGNPGSTARTHTHQTTPHNSPERHEKRERTEIKSKSRCKKECLGVSIGVSKTSHDVDDGGYHIGGST